MFLLAILLTVAAIGICAAAALKTLRLLGLDLMETLVWLGLAEVPAPPVRRRAPLALAR